MNRSIMENTIQTRSKSIVNLDQYETVNKLEPFGPEIPAQCPYEKQYVLRMLIRELNGDFKLPKEVQWVNDIIELANFGQFTRGINQPFCYLTIRHGEVESVTDDEWHVDGFSMNVTHIPEQNYIWVDSEHTTEYVEKPFYIPQKFDPKVHNLHTLLAHQIDDMDVVKSIPRNQLVAMDPYIVHRRPPQTKGQMRTFIRISFTPIEIDDVNNTPNPLIPRNYTRDGVSIRNKLVDYYAE